jgi:hypothetical protein
LLSGGKGICFIALFKLSFITLMKHTSENISRVHFMVSQFTPKLNVVIVFTEFSAKCMHYCPLKYSAHTFQVYKKVENKSSLLLSKKKEV